MLIGTFTPRTGWAGKTVEFHVDTRVFVLDGYGLVSAGQVLKYEHPPGDFEWASEETRSCVEAEAVAEAARGAAAPKARLVATFGPTTDSAKKIITFEHLRFVLEGHGPIKSADVMKLDKQGRLLWANDETRAWVESTARASKDDVEYDQQGHLVWANDETRVGVESTARASSSQQEPMSDVDHAPSVEVATEVSAEAAIDPYLQIPAKARKIYDANRGSTHVDFVIEGLSSQCLVALPESCIIVKPGFMAGVLGDGRFTEFHYADVTGIEVAAGVLTAVLEVTTPAYQGKSRDCRSVGKNSDPFKVSNCLPGGKPLFCQGEGAARIEELRRRARQAKKTPPNTTPLAATDQAEHIRKLAELRDAGILTPEAYDDVKQKTLERYSP